jgi:hypothetical protein
VRCCVLGLAVRLCCEGLSPSTFRPAPCPSPLPWLPAACCRPPQEVYARPEFGGTFDAVLTCFFIDTAHNVLHYLEVIHAVLKRGGLWIHLGLLLWHWADAGPSEVSVELCAEDVQGVAQLMGFEVLQQQLVDAAYMGECWWGGGAGLRGRALSGQCVLTPALAAVPCLHQPTRGRCTTRFTRPRSGRCARRSAPCPTT